MVKISSHREPRSMISPDAEENWLAKEKVWEIIGLTNVFRCPGITLLS